MILKQNKNNIITIYGNSGSGKTTLAMKLAKELSEEKKSVIIVFADELNTVISTIAKLKGDNREKSLGKVLEYNVTQSNIYKNLIPLNNNIACIGYNVNENVQSYPIPLQSKVKSFYSSLQNIADYIIIDTSADYVNNIYNINALNIADTIINLTSCCSKALSFYYSNKDSIEKIINKEANIIYIASNISTEKVIEYSSHIEKYNYNLPVVDEIKEQWDNLKLLLELKQHNKASMIYEQNIIELTDEILSENSSKEKANIFKEVLSKVKR